MRGGGAGLLVPGAAHAPDAETERMMQRAAGNVAKGAVPDDAADLAVVWSTQTMNPRHRGLGAEGSYGGARVQLPRRRRPARDAHHQGDAARQAIGDRDGPNDQDFHRTWEGALGVCDVTTAAEEQVQEDVRKVVRHSAQANGLRIPNDSDLACSYTLLPNF